jgi:putative glutamine amidotransferase
MERILPLLDGLLLSGGVDIDPVHFGEPPLPGMGEIAPERDAFELDLTKRSIQADLPVLAICRGIQVLNIAAGGNIYQDIPSQLTDTIKHSQLAPRWYASHQVAVERGTKLAGIFPTEAIGVNSFHHQAIKNLAPGFKVNAMAPDGIIEGIESNSNKFVVGVQWHPEGMWEKYPQMLNLFRALVQESTE